MKREFKSFDMKASIEDEGKGIVHAVVSVFGNVDSVGDVMVKGSFARSIKEGKDKGKLPPGVWAHDWNRPISKTLDAWETDEGLNIVGQCNLETKDGQDAYSNIKNEIFTEYSFGFGRIKEAEEQKDGVNFVKDVNWFEWSPVLVGANRATYTAAIKSYELAEFEKMADYEDFLREAGGFSRKDAKTFLSRLRTLLRDAGANEPDTQEKAGDESPFSMSRFEAQLIALKTRMLAHAGATHEQIPGVGTDQPG